MGPEIGPAVPIRDGWRAVVLLVDDDPDTLEALSEAIAERGVEVVTAVDGSEALALLRGGLRPTAVFLDSWMPNVDGRSVLRALRSDPAFEALPVVWMSAEGGQSPAGTGSLPKPIDVDQLNALLRDYCQGH